jgi:hypothetical protein
MTLLSLTLCLAVAAHGHGRGLVEQNRLPSTEDLDRARLDELLDLFHQMENRRQTTSGWVDVAENPQTPATMKVLQTMALDAKEGWKRALVLRALSTNDDAALMPFWKQLAANPALPTEEGVGVVRGLSSSRDPEGLRLARTLSARGDNWAEAVIDAQSEELPFTPEMAAALFDDARRAPRLRARALAELRSNALGEERFARAIKDGPPEARWVGLAFADDVAPALKVEALRSTFPSVRDGVARSFIWAVRERTPALCKALLPLSAEPKDPLAPWPGMLLIAGICQDRAGHLEEAEALYRRALASQKADGPTGPDPFEPTSELLMRLTRLATLTGRTAAARETLDELRQQADIRGEPADLPNQSHLRSGDLVSMLEKELDAPLQAKVTVKGRELTLTLTNVTKEAWELVFSEHAARPGGYPGYLVVFVDQQEAGYAANSGGATHTRIAPGQTLQFVEAIKPGAPKRGRVDVVFDVVANSASGHKFELRMQAMTVVR